MTEYKCSACGTSFPSQEALKSHATMKVTEESPHFAKLNAKGQGTLMFPGVPESEAPR
jgi:hypothetical protein